MSRRFLISIFLSDLVALSAALIASMWLVYGAYGPIGLSIPEGETLWPYLGLMTAGAVVGSWVSGRAWGNTVPRPSYGRASGIVGFTAAFVAIGLVLTRFYWSRPLFALTIVLWFVLAVGHRAIRRRRPWTEQMILVTDEKQMADDLRSAPHADVVALFDPGEEAPSSPVPAEVTLGVDVRSTLSESMARFVSSASIAGTRVRLFTSLYEEHTGRIPIVHLAEGWELSQPVHRSRYAPVKRLIDVVVTVLLLPIWLVLGAMVWIVVKVDSRGPAIYRQDRTGRNDRSFTLYKFRTMITNAEQDGPRFAAVNDARITRVGRFLRKSRFDEIPQLWNVIRGDLSLVGPRPERPVFVEDFERTIPFYGSRHLIRPGVTGWAQVNYGYADDEAETVEKLTYDLYYVKHSTVWLDLHILGMSIWTVITGFGAR
ncbi:MAG: sugar transferase [Actinomycetota bacterium]|nr:sugar transferase [Actinomycetota bacterium]